MIDDILSILANLGLLRADFKHIKKVKKEESKDGKKRPIKKYLLQPSTKLIILLLILVVPFGFILGWINDKRLLNATQEEINAISNSIDNWYETYNSYPGSLEEIISGRPLREEWLNDEWANKYYYQVDTIKNTYLIISAGSDQKFGNEDDINNK